jgi:YD repeat-containing protein
MLGCLPVQRSRGGRMPRMTSIVLSITLLVAAMTATGEAVQYQYDALGRLASACFADQTKLVTYTYDAAGNRKELTTATASCGTTAFVIDTPVPVRAGTALAFKVRRLGATSGTNAVSYATANGTAVAGTHYTSASNSLTFNAGDFDKTITVSTTAGSVASGSANLLVNLSAPTNGATVQTSQATGTLHPNALPAATNDTVWDTYYVFQVVPVYPLPNDGDPDGDALTITSASCVTTSGCSVSVVSGQYLNVSSTIAMYQVVVQYWISDGQGGTATATAAVGQFFDESPGCGEFQC